MDKYRRVSKEKNTKETPEDEIRVTATGRTATYVTYAAKLFNEKGINKCTIKATGTALATAVTIVEIIKRRFKGLHQVTHLGSTEIVDEYEPLEEGLDKVTDVRQVSYIEVTLSKESLNDKDYGYQPPISDDLVKEFSPEEMARGRGGRGGRRTRKGGKGKGKGRGRSQDASGGRKGKGKSKGKGGKSKGGKSKGKGKGEEDYYGDKGYDRSKGKGKGKSKGRKNAYGYEDEPKGKSGKGKGKMAKGDYYYEEDYSYYAGGKRSDKGKGKGKSMSKGKGKGKK